MRERSEGGGGAREREVGGGGGACQQEVGGLQALDVASALRLPSGSFPARLDVGPLEHGERGPLKRRE